MQPLTDSSLPAFFIAADRASSRAQKTALASNRIRLIAAVVAAIGGVFSLVMWSIDVWALVALVSFIVALSAELFIAIERPERFWYQARAAAESTKTLSWRYAVGADPFFQSMATTEADTLFRARVGQVAKQVSGAVDIPTGDASSPTPEMKLLRASSLENRRARYLADRTEAQRDWYTRKAASNRTWARGWRTFLISAELVAVVLAAGRLFAGWTVDLAGVLAAIIGAGAAWLALKQHVTLRAAYSLTAAEIEKQIPSLLAASEEEWPISVADAEDAISREHTMWLASRGEVNEEIG